MTDTMPANAGDQPGHFEGAILEASVSDPKTGAMWVHKDLVQARKDWEIGPPRAEESFGDVESWAAYVKRFGLGDVLLSWNPFGFRRILDYSGNDVPAGGCRWKATV